jgi:hypothetical protein
MDSPLSPVTIIGIHGSGTSMSLGRWKTMGLFVGEVKDDNHVAFFFQRIDEWLISQSEGSWTQPQAVHDLVERIANGGDGLHCSLLCCYRRGGEMGAQLSP